MLTVFYISRCLMCFNKVQDKIKNFILEGKSLSIKGKIIPTKTVHTKVPFPLFLTIIQIKSTLAGNHSCNCEIIEWINSQDMSLKISVVFYRRQ